MSTIKKALALTKLVMMAGMDGFVEANIPEIPLDWENFPNSKDKWIEVPFPESENSTACIYKAQKGGLFKPHKHNDSYEQLTITNVGGRVKLITEERIQIFEYPNSFAIPPGVIHAVEWLEYTECLIIWHPKFTEGWEAEFKKEK